MRVHIGAALLLCAALVASAGPVRASPGDAGCEPVWIGIDNHVHIDPECLPVPLVWPLDFIVWTVCSLVC